MKFPRLPFLGFCTVFLATAGTAFTQAADISLPKQREALVTTAVEAVSTRSQPVSVPDPAPNPFNWPAEPGSTEPAAVQVLENTVVIPKSELLARLAAQIPVTGTVNLGGSPLLLLGQKRLKVGDSVTINHDGQSYDLSITAIAPTSFTVRLGELTYTRPTRLSTSSRP